LYEFVRNFKISLIFPHQGSSKRKIENKITLEFSPDLAHPALLTEEAAVTRAVEAALAPEHITVAEADGYVSVLVLAVASFVSPAMGTVGSRIRCYKLRIGFL